MALRRSTRITAFLPSASPSVPTAPALLSPCTISVAHASPYRALVRRRRAARVPSISSPGLHTEGAAEEEPKSASSPPPQTQTQPLPPSTPADGAAAEIGGTAEDDLEDEGAPWDDDFPTQGQQVQHAAEAQLRLEMEFEAQRIKTTDVPVPDIDPREFFLELMGADWAEAHGDILEEYNPLTVDPDADEPQDLPASVADVTGQRYPDLSPFDCSVLRAQVVLLVGVATQDDRAEEQLQMLRNLFERYKDRGLRIVAIPSNAYGQKEPGPNREVWECLRDQFSVEFDVLEKGDPNRNTLFALGQRQFPGLVVWNFQTKFLFNRDGVAVRRFNLLDGEGEIDAAVEACLGE